MATLVPMSANAGPVTVEVTIGGILIWHVLYAADDAELSKSGTTGAASTLDLGEPDKLNRDVNAWHIAFMNPTRASVNFTVGITWKQGNNVIASWPSKPKTGTLKAGENQVLDDSAFLATV